MKTALKILQTKLKNVNLSLDINSDDIGGLQKSLQKAQKYENELIVLAEDIKVAIETLEAGQ